MPPAHLELVSTTTPSFGTPAHALFSSAHSASAATAGWQQPGGGADWHCDRLAPRRWGQCAHAISFAQTPHSNLDAARQLSGGEMLSAARPTAAGLGGGGGSKCRVVESASLAHNPALGAAGVAALCASVQVAEICTHRRTHRVGRPADGDTPTRQHTPTQAPTLTRRSESQTLILRLIIQIRERPESRFNSLIGMIAADRSRPALPPPPPPPCRAHLRAGPACLHWTSRGASAVRARRVRPRWPGCWRRAVRRRRTSNVWDLTLNM